MVEFRTDFNSIELKWRKKFLAQSSLVESFNIDLALHSRVLHFYNMAACSHISFVFVFKKCELVVGVF